MGSLNDFLLEFIPRKKFQYLRAFTFPIAFGARRFSWLPNSSSEIVDLSAISISGRDSYLFLGSLVVLTTCGMSRYAHKLEPMTENQLIFQSGLWLRAKGNYTHRPFARTIVQFGIDFPNVDYSYYRRVTALSSVLVPDSSTTPSDSSTVIV